MSNKLYTKEEMLGAFHDGLICGIASEINTFGTEDFMGLEAAAKADAFIEKEGKSVITNALTNHQSTGLQGIAQYCGLELDD